MKSNRKKKSNRAQADYFELLITQYICYLYNLNFKYSKDLAVLSNKILKLPEGSKRLKLQNDNLLKIIAKLKDILRFEVREKGKVVDVVWVGRRLTIKTTSDVDTKHIKNNLTRFSIKSISKSGTGTIKNLGMRSLNKYLGVDFDKEYKKMWKDLKLYVGDSKIIQSKLKRKIRRNKKMLNWVMSNGKKYQKKFNSLCLDAFNKLSKKEKVEFLNFILDAYDKNLYVVIANEKGAVIYKPISKKIKLVSKIKAKNDSGVGYIIFIDNVPTYRIQTNATNGIGISAFCQRVFFADLDA